MELCVTRGKRVVTSVAVTAPWLRANFQYTNRIYILLCFNACGELIEPGATFKGSQEPRLTNGAHYKRVSNLIPTGWHDFWRRDVISFDGFIFKKLVSLFVREVRSSHPEH